MVFDPIASLRHWKEKVASLQERWRGARREIEELRKQEEAQRAAKRQAAPFSRGTRKLNPNPPGRKSGSAYGQHSRKAIPQQVDEVIAVPPPSHCECGGELEVERIESQYQQEIVRKTIWRRFDFAIARCKKCHKRVQGRDPRQTSDALEQPRCN